MRSFSNYRKNCLKESLNKFSARGSSSALFDILRIDLLEASHLPNLLTENIVHKNEFNEFKKDLELQNKYIIDTTCDYAKNVFYDAVLKEADNVTRTAIDPAAAFRMLRDELKAKLSEMIQQLKVTILSTGSAARSADPVDDGSSNTGATSGSPAGAAMGGSPGGASASTQPTTHGTVPTNGPSSTGNTASAGGQQSWLDKYKPKDGWLNGVGRVLGRPFRDVGRYIKKNWFDENKTVIESMLFEQDNKIASLLDNFEREIIAWFDKRVGEIARDAGIDLGSNTKVNPAKPTTSNPITPAGIIAADGSHTADSEPQDFEPMNTKADQQTNGTDAAVVIGGSDIERAAEQGNPQAQSIVRKHHENLMAGASALGFNIKVNAGWGSRGKKAANPQLGNPTQELKIDGKPATEIDVPVIKRNKQVLDPQGQPVFRKLKTNTDLLREIIKRIFIKFGGNPKSSDLYTTSLPQVAFNDISSKLGGLTNNLNGSKIALITELLLKMGAQSGGSSNSTTQSTPVQQGSSPMQQDQPDMGQQEVDPAQQGQKTGDQNIDPIPQIDGNQAGVGDAPMNNPSVAEINPQKKIDHFTNMIMAKINKSTFKDAIFADFGGPENAKLGLKHAIETSDLDSNMDSEAVFAAIKTKFIRMAKSHWRPDQSVEEPQEPQLDPNQTGDASVAEDPALSPDQNIEQPQQPQLDPNQTDDASAVEDPALSPDQSVEEPQEPSEDLTSQIKSLAQQHGEDSHEFGQALIFLYDDLLSGSDIGEDEQRQMTNMIEKNFNREFAVNPKQAIKDLTISLMKLKKQISGQPHDNFGENYKLKIDKYCKLIKENNLSISPINKLREKLGLLS